MTRWDHFHAVYVLDGEEVQLEGGLTPRDDDEIKAMKKGLDEGTVTLDVYNQWVTDFQVACCKSFGMPEGCRILNFRVAG